MEILQNKKLSRKEQKIKLFLKTELLNNLKNKEKKKIIKKINNIFKNFLKNKYIKAGKAENLDCLSRKIAINGFKLNKHYLLILKNKLMNNYINYLKNKVYIIYEEGKNE